MHPAMLGEVIARELLAEILHHVVALELAMNEHVDADLLLPAHGGLGLFPQEGVVVGIVQCAASVMATNASR